MAASGRVRRLINSSLSDPKRIYGAYKFSLELALQKGADPNAHLENGLTPLMLAGLVDESLMTATILCRYGADPFKLDGLCRFNAIEFAENEGLVSLANYLKKADELS